MGLEGITIIAPQPVANAQPQKAKGILHNATGVAVGKPLFGAYKLDIDDWAGRLCQQA